MPVVVLGTLALAGYVTVRRALDSTIDEADVESAIDVTVIESAVGENGLRAVTDTETLDAAINNEELDRELDVQRLQTAVEESIPTVEQAVNADDIESILAHEFDAATDRGLSAITEQDVVEGTIEDGEIGVTADLDELRAVLEDGTTALERTTAAVAEQIGARTDTSMLDAGDESPGESRRIAVVDEQGGLESLLADNERGTDDDSHPQSIDIEDPDARTDDSGQVNGDETNGPSSED
jgi:hypothetical protein